MEGKDWKKVLLITVACLAVLALVVGIAVAVTTTGNGEDAEHATDSEGSDSDEDCDTGTGDGITTGAASRSGSGMGTGTGTMQGYWSEAMNDVAVLLGLSEEELHEETDSGKTLAQVAGEKGVSPDEVVDTIIRKVDSLADAEFAAGDVTTEQADRVKTVVAARAHERVENGYGGGIGHDGDDHDHEH